MVSGMSNGTRSGTATSNKQYSPDTSRLRETGYSGPLHNQGAITEEADSDLRGLSGVKIYDNMRRSDPTVAVGLRAIDWILQRVPWRVVEGGQSSEDEDARDFLDSCMSDMTFPWAKLMRDALTCLAFGWAYCEIVYKVRQGRTPPEGEPASQYDDGKIGWRKISLIAQNTLDKWLIDPTGGIQGMYQTQPGPAGTQRSVLIPIEKALLFRIDDERNNPEGVSLLRPVYNAWYAKSQLQEIEAIGVERDLTGVLIIYMPTQATDADYAKAKDLLEQYKADDMTGFVAPQFGPNQHEQWRFEIINSPGNKSIDVGQVITRYSHEIARMFLVQFLLLGDNGSGSFALSSDQRDIFQLALETILDAIADTVNRYAVPRLMLLNGYEKLEKYPTIKHGRIAKSDMLKFSQAVSALQSAKLINYTEEDEIYVREELDLPNLPEDFDWKDIQERTVENAVEMTKETAKVTPQPAAPANRAPARSNPGGTGSQGQPRPGGRSRSQTR